MLKPKLLVLALSFLSLSAWALPLINLSLDGVNYCSTTQIGNTFTGVQPGYCSAPPTPTPPPTPPPGACPAGRQTTATISWNYSLTDERTIDVTHPDPMFGTASPTDSPHSFPWVQGFHVIDGMRKTGYLAMQFTVPTNLPPSQFGLIFHGETWPGPNLSASISSTCGDFAPADSGCHRENVGPGAQVAKWKLPTAQGYGCILQPGQTYYFNVKMTSPPASFWGCSGTSCKVTLQSNHN